MEAKKRESIFFFYFIETTIFFFYTYDDEMFAIKSRACHVGAFREMIAYIVRTKKSLHSAKREGVHLALSPELGTGL